MWHWRSSQNAFALIFGGCSSPTWGRKGKYIPCNHQYYVFLIVLQANPIVDICIHNATRSDYKVAELLNNDPFVGWFKCTHIYAPHMCHNGMAWSTCTDKHCGRFFPSMMCKYKDLEYCNVFTSDMGATTSIRIVSGQPTLCSICYYFWFARFGGEYATKPWPWLGDARLCVL